jgi:hypothetical protein
MPAAQVGGAAAGQRRRVEAAGEGEIGDAAAHGADGQLIALFQRQALPGRKGQSARDGAHGEYRMEG